MEKCNVEYVLNANIVRLHHLLRKSSRHVDCEYAISIVRSSEISYIRLRINQLKHRELFTQRKSSKILRNLHKGLHLLQIIFICYSKYIHVCMYIYIVCIYSYIHVCMYIYKLLNLTLKFINIQEYYVLELHLFHLLSHSIKLMFSQFLQ